MTKLQVNNNGLLTPRETQALELVAWGKDNEEIGLCLGIGRRTAKDYVEHTMQKLHVHNRTHLITEAFRVGILKFMCFILIIQGGLFIPAQSARETTQELPFRTRNDGRRRTQNHTRFTRSVQLRAYGRKI